MVIQWQHHRRSLSYVLVVVLEEARWPECLRGKRLYELSVPELLASVSSLGLTMLPRSRLETAIVSAHPRRASSAPGIPFACCAARARPGVRRQGSIVSTGGWQSGCTAVCAVK
eukprot:CAMPEP_0119406534 /NCGR_PEP_ID=MMETSP1335-20130426/829_1 /TAXON_ID=259385 /ORGANISM="Chrysoculter rhomboideus, Strain RCC1486" /LENGTH=113 /DNA_ID=CAMNT_0007430615 /DNA_START=188 /DNA_END=526 /DNA_ORIENTATION=-